TDEFASAVTPALTAPARVAAVQKLDKAAADPLHAHVSTVLALPQHLGILQSAVAVVANNVAQRAQHLESAAGSPGRDWLSVTIASTLLAIVIRWLTNRWITRPLRSLADQAATMAGESLPGAVQQILEAPLGEELQPPEVAPVHVKAGGEVHDVE